MNRKLFTSEAVTEGHPDKVCDKISDAILDADENARVACETCCTTGMVIVMGEISTTAHVDISDVVRRTVKEIGYDDPETGSDGDSCAVLVALDKQSPDISLGTNDEVGGAGDQGMMFGYACRETSDYMPLPITLANRLALALAVCRKSGLIDYIYPDGKTQVTIEYDENDEPIRIDTIVVSTQHKADVSMEKLRTLIVEHVVEPVLRSLKEEKPDMNISDYRLFVNPTGRFVKGGPAADSGLTGRKIIVDTYGGYAPHGGGAFSGKDPTKVDRSGAYMARYIAKNIVAAGIAEKCQVQLAYAIGVAEPVSVRVDTFDTGLWADEIICKAICEVFDLTPQGIIRTLDLRKSIYSSTAAYGHFGEVVKDGRAWEKVDKVAELEEAFQKYS